MIWGIKRGINFDHLMSPEQRRIVRDEIFETQVPTETKDMEIQEQLETQLEIIEKHWYLAAQEFIGARGLAELNAAREKSDALLDAYLDIGKTVMDSIAITEPIPVQ